MSDLFKTLEVSDSKFHLCSCCQERESQSCGCLYRDPYEGDYDCIAPFDEFIFWTDDFEDENDGWKHIQDCPCFYTYCETCKLNILMGGTP